MGATGDRSAIVSASLPQLVQYSGQGFNQLHLPLPLHSTPSHSPTPHPNHFSNPARAWVGAVSLCLSALVLSSVHFPMTHLFLTVLLRRLYPGPPSFLHWLQWLHHWLLWPSDSLNLTFRHRVHLLFVCVNTARGIWSMHRLSIGNAARPVQFCRLSLEDS